jgi:hypothetical protein
MNLKSVEPDNDAEFDPEEIEAATEERVTPESAPEVNAKTEKLTEWDQPVSEAGGNVPKTPFEDETTIANELIEEGIDEADREQRIAAADPDFEP